jgi:hypothetical protein
MLSSFFCIGIKVKMNRIVRVQGMHFTRKENIRIPVHPPILKIRIAEPAGIGGR